MGGARDAAWGVSGDRVKKLLSNGVTVFIVIGAIAVIAFDGFSSSLLPDGTVAPELKFEKLGGGTLEPSDLAGQVVLLDFWATWCPPCREEMPWLVSLEKEFEAKGVRFVAASEDDERPLVGIYAKDKVPGLEPYAVFSNAAVVQKYRVAVLPTLYVIGRDGKIVASTHGSTSEWRVRRWLNAALDAK
jgi:thiol-disulfide isomerase/thioredoxin